MSPSSDPVVRVGIVGLGRSGWKIHAHTIARLGDKYRVVAVCDPDPQRQQEARDKFGCRAYADFAEILRDPDAELLVIASPSHLHADYAIRAMQAGKAVIVEKPMATSLADVDRMIAVSKATGRLLTVFQNYRYSADFLKAREVINSGKLGRILLVRLAWHGFYRRWDWQTLKEYGGGQLNIVASHVVDRALVLLGDREPKVFCHAETTPLWSGDAEGHVKIILQAEGAPMIDIEITCACPYPQDRWIIMGTQGGLSGTEDKMRWKYLDPRLLVPRPLTREPIPDRTYFGREPLPWIEESCDLSADLDNGDARYYLDLYRCLREGAPLPVTPESVRREIAVLDECRRQNPR